MENWKEFLGKYVLCIVEDKPMPNPKSKKGSVLNITETHLILKNQDKTEAIRLNDIRRIEIKNGTSK